jgi:hypothetical protein
MLFAGHFRISLSSHLLLKTLEDKIHKPGIFYLLFSIGMELKSHTLQE